MKMGRILVSSINTKTCVFSVNEIARVLTIPDGCHAAFRPQVLSSAGCALINIKNPGHDARLVFNFHDITVIPMPKFA
jgi:hypothetical protein